MRDDDSNWFSKWEEELPSPEELMPLSQTLITPNLALAFNIPNPNQNPHHPPPPPPPPPAPHSAALSSQPNSSAEFDSGGADEPARTLKRPRLVWTPQLHKRFVDAVIHLGIKNAVPKTIMQLMSVDGLTRENVASHLQKYRLYLKRTQGISAAGASGQAASGVDSATDHFFASSLVPPHFLHSGTAPASGGSDHFMPFIPMAAAIHQQQQQQQHMVGPPPAAHHQIQKPFQHFEHPFRRQQQPPQAQRIGPPVHGSNGVGSIGYSNDLEMTNRRKVLTLFPTGND